MRQLIPIALLMCLAGCASQPSTTPGPSSSTPVNTSLASLIKDSAGSPVAAPPPAPAPVPADPTDRLVQDQPDIQAILDRDRPADTPAPTAVAIETHNPEVVTPSPEPEPLLPVEPPKTLAEQIDETSLVLTDLLRQNTLVSDSPFSAALALAAMEAIRPGSAPKVITPDSVDGGPLSDEQRDIVNAFRELVAGMAAAGAAKPGELTDRSVELGNTFARARPMRINAALAAKVTGYGQYIPLDTRRLQQGKPAKAVVYTEVKRFSQRPVNETDADHGQAGDRYAVELSQELQLIHDADGVKAWQRPEQMVIESSRSYRSDFYLVQNITLPSTLSIGAYKLKVIVRDKIGGHLDEVNIPIEVVADPTLVQESAKGLYD